MKVFVPVLFLFMFVITACQPTGTVMMTATNSPLPVTLTPTKTLTATRTSLPTFTPTFVSTSTPENESRYIELPDWVKDAENNILLLPYLTDTDTPEQPSKFIFVNPKNGEQAWVELSKKYYFYYWKDTNHVVFLQEGWCDEKQPDYIAELDIPTGKIWDRDVSEYPELVRDNCYYFDKEEKNVKTNWELPELTVETFDPSLGNTYQLTNPNDGINDISYELSPNKNYIAIVQIRGKYEYSELVQPEYGKLISIYSLPDRRLLMTFDEGRDISTDVMFLDNENLVYVREDTPCLVMIASLEKKCIRNISEKFPGATIIIGDPLSDPKRMAFIYFGPEHHGGFCFYDLRSGALDCPTDHFPIFDKQIIINYSLSPNEKYLLVAYDRKGCPFPWCDYFAGPLWAVIDIEGGQLFTFGYANPYPFYRPVQPSPWRPLD